MSEKRPRTNDSPPKGSAKHPRLGSADLSRRELEHRSPQMSGKRGRDELLSASPLEEIEETDVKIIEISDSCFDAENIGLSPYNSPERTFKRYKNDSSKSDEIKSVANKFLFFQEVEPPSMSSKEMAELLLENDSPNIVEFFLNANISDLEKEGPCRQILQVVQDRDFIALEHSLSKNQILAAVSLSRELDVAIGHPQSEKNFLDEFTTYLKLEQELTTWRDGAVDYRQYCLRQSIFNKMENCYLSKTKMLDLYAVPLAEVPKDCLPYLAKKVEKLYIGHSCIENFAGKSDCTEVLYNFLELSQNYYLLNQELTDWQNEASDSPEELSKRQQISNQIEFCYLLQENSLNLCNQNLGKLPEWIKYLKHLTVILNLSGNLLSSLPAGIEQLTNLQSLILDDNQLEKFPNSLGKLTALETLNLVNNHLTDLQGIGSLTALKHISITKNRLENLPEEFSQLTLLEDLYIIDNPLIELSPSIGQLTNLKTLVLINLKLKQLPDSIGNLERLEKLHLTKTPLTSLPSTIGNLKELEQFYFSVAFHELGNPSCGLKEIPSEIGSLTSLKWLSLGSHQLTQLPDSIGQLTNLTHLNLQGNKLSVIPETIGQLTNLIHLNLQGNKLSVIPETIGNLEKLSQLYLQENRLETLPSSMGNLKDLSLLILTDNELTEIPLSLATSLSSRCEIDCRSNQLSGEAIDDFSLLATTTRTQNPTLGPMLDISLDEDEEDEELDETKSLNEYLEIWFERFKTAFPERLNHPLLFDKTQTLESFYGPLLSHPNNDLVRNLLQKCAFMKDFKNELTRNGVIEKLDLILRTASENKGFRDKFFEALADASDGCGDRYAMIFDKIHALYQVHCIMFNNPEELPNLLIGIHRCNVLNEIAQKKLKEITPESPDEEIDDVEIFLYYQVNLKEALELPISTEEMLFPRMASKYILADDLENARKEVLEKTTSTIDRANILIQSESWKEKLRKDHREIFDEELNPDLLKFHEDLEKVTGNSGEQLEQINKILAEREKFISDKARELTLNMIPSSQSFGKNEA
jgi:Leucine-rich repeat (LRR) protein